MSTNKKFYIGEINKAKSEEFKASNLCIAIVKEIMAFTNLDRNTTEETARVQYCIPTENIAERIAFAIVTANKTMPLETIVGMVGTSITKKNKDEKFVVASLLVASEFVLYASNLMSLTPNKLFNIRKTVNGKFIVTNLYKQEHLGEKTFYPLPTPEPTTTHRCLGDYDWKSTQTAGVEKLNKTKFTVLQIEETEPLKFLSAKDERIGLVNELWTKWNIRKQILPKFKGETFHFNWHQDYRNRKYAGAYFINPQGNEYEKNIMAFADFQNITFKGKQKVKHAIARAMGEWVDHRRLIEIKSEITTVSQSLILSDDEKQEIYEILDEEIAEINSKVIKLDKLTDIEKAKWYEENNDLLLEPEVAIHADEPTALKAQLHSMNLINTMGMTNIPVEIDATCSQLQIVSALMGCRKTAQTCNIITDNNQIADAYRIMAEYMSKLSGMKFNRSQIKAAFMIDGYGAGKKLVTETLQKSLKDYYTPEVVDIFYKAQALMSPTVQILKDTFNSIWNDKKTHYKWTMPNGFVVDYRPSDSYYITIRPFGNMELTVKSTLVSATPKSSGLGVNVIHSFDGYICDEVIVNHPNNQIWTIHDGFRCHPNDVDAVLENYNNAIASLVDSTALENVISEIIEMPVNPIKKQFTGAEVRTSKYSVC